MHFVHNLETDKIHVHTDGREAWRKLPNEISGLIKRFCIFSRSDDCWHSKGKAGQVWWLDKLSAAGFEDRGKEGEPLTFASQVELKQLRAEQRAERYETRSDKAESESAALFNSSHAMMSAIPMGQPILIGHYSEGRDRNYRARAWAKLGKAVETGKRAEHYASRAETARQTAEGAQYSDAAFLGRRIKECDKEVRTIMARLDGRYHLNSEEVQFEPDEEYKQRLSGLLETALDKLEFYEACLEKIGGAQFTRESLQGKTHVKVRSYWHEIVKLNQKTVSVPNICFPKEEDQRRWAFKRPYAEVQEAR